jgi:hypothetical protein
MVGCGHPGAFVVSGRRLTETLPISTRNLLTGAPVLFVNVSVVVGNPCAAPGRRKPADRKVAASTRKKQRRAKKSH